MSALRACVLCLLVALSATGCGGQSESDRVGSTVKLFADATAQHDYTTLCQKVLAPELIAKLKPFNITCEIAVRQYFGDVRSPRIDIRKVTLLGKKDATASVLSAAAGQPTSTAELRLTNTPAGWRITRLASSPAATPPCPDAKRAPGAKPCLAPEPGAAPPGPSTPND